MGYDIEKEKREAIEAGRRALNSLQAAKENKQTTTAFWAITQ